MFRLACVVIFCRAAAEPSPVPYSNSTTDGMPTLQDWKLFDSLHQQVLDNSDMKRQRFDLLNYAADKVRKSLNEISLNIKALKVKGFDMVWPGDGFNGVAYGGLYEVIMQLEKADVLQAGKLMGSSGGAASTILAMAGSDTLLKLYQVYQLYYEGHAGRLRAEIWRDTGVTSAIYAEAMRDAAAFSRAQKNACIVSRCSSDGNTIFRGFQTLNQLVAAGYSSGDASIGGLAVGTVVDGSHVKHCSDGGSVTVFPPEAASIDFGVLKYETPWISTSYPTAESISQLFLHGVDTAIEALKSPSLSGKVDGGRIFGTLPGPKGIVTATEFEAAFGEAASAHDVDLSAHLRALQSQAIPEASIMYL